MPKELFATITRRLVGATGLMAAGLTIFKKLLRISTTHASLPAPIEKQCFSCVDVIVPLQFLIITRCLCVLVGTLFGLLPESLLPEE